MYFITLNFIFLKKYKRGFSNIFDTIKRPSELKDMQNYPNTN